MPDALGSRRLATVIGFNVWLYLAKASLVLVSLVLMPVVLVLGKALPRQKGIKFGLALIWSYGRVWFWLSRPLLGFAIVGQDRLTAPPYIFVANHQSILDIYCFGAQRIWATAMVVRGWPLRVPFLAPFMRLSGYLDAEQDPYSFALQATRLLDWGISLLFFPEGTRRKEVPLAKFQSGAFWLAVRTQTPIVPVCIKGTGRLLPPGKKTFTPGKIGIEFLSPVNPSRFAQEDRPVRALSEHVQHRMRACLVAS